MSPGRSRSARDAQRRPRSGGNTGPRGNCRGATSAGRSRLVVARMRTLTRTGALPPTRSISRSCRARSSLACSRTSISLISSSSSVPPSAASNLPTRRASGAAERALLVAEQFAFEQVLRDRGAVQRHERPAGAARLRRWMWRASTSLPVPLSPVISTEASGRATCSARRSAASIAGSRTTSACALAAGGLQDGGDQVGVGRQRQEFARAGADRPHRRLGVRVDAAGDDRNRHPLGRERARPARRYRAPGRTAPDRTRASARSCASAASTSSAWSSLAPRAPCAMRAAWPSSPASEPMMRTRMSWASPASCELPGAFSDSGRGRP